MGIDLKLIIVDMTNIQPCCLLSSRLAMLNLFETKVSRCTYLTEKQVTLRKCCNQFVGTADILISYIQ